MAQRLSTAVNYILLSVVLIMSYASYLILYVSYILAKFPDITMLHLFRNILNDGTAPRGSHSYSFLGRTHD